MTPQTRVRMARALWQLIEGSEAEFLDIQRSIFWDPVYQRPPCDMEEFLLSQDYLGLTDEAGKPYVHRRLMQLLILADEDAIREIYLCLGKDSGKSFFAACMACRMVYTLSCLVPSPQHALPNIAPGSGIQIINLATDSHQAKRSVFKELEIKIAGRAGKGPSRWFERFGFEKLADRFIFPNNIEILCGHSRAEAWLGANTILGIIDEASYFTEAKGLKSLSDSGYPTSLAEKNYNAFYGSCRSRFPNHYKIILISSPKHQGDFLFRKIERIKQAGNMIDVDSVPLRTPCHAQKVAEAGAIRRAGLSEFDIGILACTDGPRLAVQAPSWELKDDETILDYEDDFNNNPIMTARDFGAQPYLAEAPFFDFERVARCIDPNRKPPLKFLSPPGEPEMDIPESVLTQKRRLSNEFSGHPERDYFAHIDFATGGKSGKGDACGFALGHLEEAIGQGGRVFYRVFFDLVTRFQYANGKPVDAEDLCDFVPFLKVGRGEFRPARRLEPWETHDGAGFSRLSVSIDGFNRELLSQLLAKRGVQVEYFSPDKSRECWQLAEFALYKAWVSLYRHPILEAEIMSLQVTDSGIPDHPPNGSKDMLDAVISVIYRALTTSRAALPEHRYTGVKG
ncbi:MAG: hypothetical protein DRH70_04905 [Candidatus Coatesbacteria bacterium]|nr:MAG: hypothetical protein DRH70_04905 [Candidatus Coatesbacteria bacterium]